VSNILIFKFYILNIINSKLCLVLECWDGEPDNRPTIYQVVDRLSAIITKTDIIIENPQLSSNQEFNEAPLSINNSKLQGELSKPNTKEIDTTAVSDKQEKSLTNKDFSRALADVLHRPLGPKVPKFALKLMF